MNDEELQTFLARPMTAVVATVGRNGGAHSVPVWFAYVDGAFIVWTDANRQWVKNARANPHISITVAEHEPPFAAVVARGEAEVLDDPPSLAADIRKIVERYIPSGEVDAYIEPWGMLRTIVRLVPTTTRAWARGY